jgi:hypothetical protein
MEYTVRIEEVCLVRSRAGRVDSSLCGRFEQAYAAWKRSWDDPLIAVSSAPGARATTPEFLDLIALGRAIVPLLMEKLTNPDDFFALVAVDQLCPELRIDKSLKDESILLGEQGRAVETLRHWLQAMN